MMSYVHFCPWYNLDPVVLAHPSSEQATLGIRSPSLVSRTMFLWSEQAAINVREFAELGSVLNTIICTY